MMKKTLLALTVAALAASSAQAYKSQIQETGTDIDFNGSLRVKWESTSNTTDTYGSTPSQKKDHINHAVSNNGSRFGFKVKQKLTDDFYALGRVEWRLRGEADSQHDFDHLYTRILYAGFGYKHAEKQFSELTYGNMPTITDEVKRTDLANTYSLSDGLLDSAARRATQYTYTSEYENGDKVRAGIYYGGVSKRGDTNLDLKNPRKNVWGVGSIYEHKINDIQSVSFGAGFTREISANTNANNSFATNAYSLGASYTFVNTTYGIDLERQVTNHKGSYDNKNTKNEIRTIVLQKFNNPWTYNNDLNVYAMYAYKTDKDHTGSRTEKTKNQFMVGTEYYVYKQGSIKVKPFVEWQATRTKTQENGVETSKAHDYKTVVGLRAYW